MPGTRPPVGKGVSTLPGWVVLSVGYGVTLIFALVRTVYTDVTVPASIDSGLFARPGQIWIAVAMSTNPSRRRATDGTMSNPRRMLPQNHGSYRWAPR